MSGSLATSSTVNPSGTVILLERFGGEYGCVRRLVLAMGNHVRLIGEHRSSGQADAQNDEWL